jgi:hypothetical protein
MIGSVSPKRESPLPQSGLASTTQHGRQGHHFGACGVGGGCTPTAGYAASETYATVFPVYTRGRKLTDVRLGQKNPQIGGHSVPLELAG